VDALRIYLMSSALMKGEDANFSEKAVQDIASKIIGRLFNVLAFYELYRDKNLEKIHLTPSPISLIRRGVGERFNVLDQWILSRFYQMLSEITEGMENYDMAEATRPIDLFVDDLSTWYLRRSRERIKEEAANPALEQAQYGARQTLYFVLKTLAKIMAPFAPFTAEDIWLKLKNENDVESAHLESWPVPLRQDLSGSGKIIQNMEEVRNIVTLGLEARQQAKIQVRQPLSELRIKNYELGIEYLELIKDELNIKEIKQDKNLKTETELDIKITPELKQEGNYRELARALQDMRKKMGLTPSDFIALSFETNDTGKKLIQKFENEMKKTTLVSQIKFEENNGEEVKIDELVFKIKIDKIQG
ncbi:MAG: class I tRNA ligase family protein, partial [Chloroflexota bacterium]